VISVVLMFVALVAPLTEILPLDAWIVAVKFTVSMLLDDRADAPVRVYAVPSKLTDWPALLPVSLTTMATMPVVSTRTSDPFVVVPTRNA